MPRNASLSDNGCNLFMFGGNNKPFAFGYLHTIEWKQKARFFSFRMLLTFSQLHDKFYKIYLFFIGV